MSAGAVAAQLNRSRARLRVEYLLALEDAEPPTEIFGRNTWFVAASARTVAAAVVSPALVVKKLRSPNGLSRKATLTDSASLRQAIVSPACASMRTGSHLIAPLWSRDTVTTNRCIG